MNIKKRCNKAGCNKYININETYCTKHNNHSTKEYNKQYEKMRKSTEEGKEYKLFYSRKEWRTLRYQALLRDGFICVRCGREAKVADHIIPTKIRWDLRLDFDNLQSLCFECHNSKTSEDRREYGNMVQ